MQRAPPCNFAMLCLLNFYSKPMNFAQSSPWPFCDGFVIKFRLKSKEVGPELPLAMLLWCFSYWRSIKHLLDLPRAPPCKFAMLFLLNLCSNFLIKSLFKINECCPELPLAILLWRSYWNSIKNLLILPRAPPCNFAMFFF